MRAVPGCIPCWFSSDNLALARITMRVLARQHLDEIADRRANDIVANKSRKKKETAWETVWVWGSLARDLSYVLRPLIQPDSVTHRLIGICRSLSHVQRSDAFPSFVPGTAKTRNDSLVVSWRYRDGGHTAVIPSDSREARKMALRAALEW